MRKGIFIIGTDTDAGKTFVTAGLTYALKQNKKDVIPYKPVQSGGNGDTRFYKEIADLDYSIEEMNTYTLKEAVSPHLACKLENKKINKELILNHYKKLINSHDYVIVEGAGGIVVPLVDKEYYIYDLIKDLNLEVVIVARAGVGTINHTVLTNEFLKTQGIKAKGIIINQYNNKFYEDDNIKQIKELTNLEIIHKFNKLEDFSKESIEEEYKKIDENKLIELIF
ncbi:dethiobiotin synthase [Terrisporobacter mayombei]|uniref:ATP-dependent dethiobiotin synthetase BioD n=1 Tax=Terrisporobacter mayombei TaxID=1541 RepID=A0ABY9Q6Q6_9FIRM|nr:dethiobiotin synthase [Terrisporobacter mayombei]MCC3868961.1 dethiobiotin synthase [Terrisporobacter mayombei]WMT82905.1 ATP-dependent dethiobiotin synthetase BioD [Terrisporobacter mayombei]